MRFHTMVFGPMLSFLLLTPLKRKMEYATRECLLRQYYKKRDI
jgi:hypothetical protein